MLSSFRIRLVVLVFCSSLVKFLLFPAAHSTDLEVHRHWKALTVSRPLSQWYWDDSSVWTLDYPPAFAFFEYILGRFLALLRPSLVDMSNHGDDSWRTVYLLRFTVLALEPLLALSLCYLFRSTSNQPETDSSLFIIALLLFNPALIVVDNVHFQYNLLPLSFLFLALAAANTSAFSTAAAIFALTVNLKHTLFSVALPFVVYVLSHHYHHQFQKTGKGHRLNQIFVSIIRIVMTTVVTLALPWIPFIIAGGMPLLLQMRNRLFPFDRGLFHANWAPNFWAFYAVCDKLLLRFAGCRFRTPDISITSGHIGSIRPFTCLPNPTPAICVTLLIIAITPVLVNLAAQPSKLALLRAVVATALASALFGWHVHEKALLVALLPLLSTLKANRKYQSFVFAALLLDPATDIAVLDLVANDPTIIFARFFCYGYFFLLLAAFGEYLSRKQYAVVRAYVMTCSLVELYANAGVHRFIFGSAMLFLPKLMVSLTSFVGVMATFLTITSLNIPVLAINEK